MPKHKLALQTLIAFLLAAPTTAKSDILFLDINNAPEEIKAARRALKPGEKLYVIPSEDSKIRRQETEKIRAQITSLRRQAMSEANPDRSQELWQESVNLQDQVNKTRITNDTIKDELGKALGAGIKPTRWVISAHDGNGHFNGDFGDLTQPALTKAFQAHPEACAGLTSMFLWGCWTTNPGSLIKNWKKICPSVRVFGGFDDSGPSRENRIGQRVLEQMLKRDADLQQATTIKQLSQVFNKIPQIRQTTAAICANDNLVSVRHPARNIRDIDTICTGTANSPLFRKYECYYNGEPGCADPPANTASGEIRQFYRELQDTSVCEVLGAQNPLPSREIVLRLIFFKKVKEQFMRSHGKALQNAQLAFDRIGVQAKLTDLLELPRGEMIPRLHSLRTEIEGLLSKGNTPPEAVSDLIYALDTTLSLDRILLRLEPNCVPFDWIEDRTLKSPCFSERVF